MSTSSKEVARLKDMLVALDKERANGVLLQLTQHDFDHRVTQNPIHKRKVLRTFESNSGHDKLYAFLKDYDCDYYMGFDQQIYPKFSVEILEVSSLGVQ